MKNSTDIKEEMPSQFEKELTALINRHSLENGSNTPDFILASYLRSCLDNFNRISRWRERWYGKALSIGGVKDPDEPQALPPTAPPTLSGSIRICRNCGKYLIMSGCCGRITAHCSDVKCRPLGKSKPCLNFDLACQAFNEQVKHAQISSPAPRPVATDACADHGPVSGTQDESASPAPTRGDVS